MKTWLDLTDGFPVQFDVERMKADLERFQNSDAWLPHYDSELSQGWRAILLKSKNGEISGPDAQRPSWDFSDYQKTPYASQLPYFSEILDALKCPQGRMRVLRLQPGMRINLHRDVGPEVACVAFRQVRLHVPIITNDQVTFFVGGEKIQMKPGRLYYVNFSKPHFVRNDGTESRIHLVMDVKMNDWLAGYFPDTTRWERFEFATARATWPTLWRVRWWRTKSVQTFWKHYEGSHAQSAVHRVRGKHRAAA